MAVLDLMLFGGFRARLDSGNELARPSRKGQLLLACLALRAGEPQTREKLIGLLWSDRGDQQARASLRQELTGLRKVLGCLQPSPVIVDGESVSLDAAAVAVDVRQFERLMQSDATADLERAVALYHGPFLDGLAVRDPACEEWLRHERERLRLLMLGVLDRLLARQLTSGVLAQATATAEAILAQDPLREDTHRTLMQLHADQGRHSLALKQFQACKDMLARELGVEPEPETIRLHNEIAARRAAPPAPSLQSVGSGDASQYYLMGRSFFLRNVWGKRALDVARRLFLQAIEADPSYARAYAGLANCDCYRLLLGLPDASFEAIVANSTRALELAPDLAEAHAAKGLTLYTAGRYEEANDSFERAVTLGPESFEAHYFYARSCRVLDQHDKAARLFERAAAINQNDFRSLGFLADEYRAMGRLDDSLTASRRCLARINVEVAAQPDDGHALAFGSAVLAELGERERAEDWAARALRIDAHDAIVNYNLACTYAQLGRPDSAVERLRAIFASFPINRRAFVEWMRQDSALDPLRDHPDYLALAVRLGEGIATAVPERAAAVPAAPAPEGRPSIAVLPFANMSHDPEQEFFAAGLTEDIVTDLSRFRLLRVMSGGHSSRERNDANPQRIGRELGVGYVLIGTVRRLRAQLRLTAQLIETASGDQLWAERFDRDAEDLFVVADQLVRTIVGTIAGRLQAVGSERAARRPPASLAAYECVLRARACQVGDRAAEAEMRRLYERAVALDPGYGRAYAGLAVAHFREWFRDTTGSDAELNRAFELATKGVALDEHDSECQETLGWILLHRRSFDLAERYYRRALDLNPNSPDELAAMGSLCSFLGRPQEGIDWFEQARSVDPFFGPNWYWNLLGAACFNARKYDDAVAAFGRSSAMPVWVQAYLAACHAHAGRAEQAAALAADLARRAPEFSPSMLAAKEPYRSSADREHLREGLRKAGVADDRSATAIPASGRTDAADNGRAIAVLPFEDRSGDQAYFSDGLTDDLITALSLWRSFPVIARNSTFSYKGRAVEAKQIARELGARYIVEGSVRKAAGRVRVAVQLVDGETGHHAWAGKYDRELSDIFAVQDDLTQQIAAIIAPEVERVEGRRTGLKRPCDLGAWDFYLRGMALLAQFTPAGNKAARAMFEQAVALDPGYADGHVGLALSHNRDLLLQCAVDRDVSIGQAMDAARRAVALDPASPAAHSVLGTVHIWRGENDLALAAARLAHDLNPYDATNLHALGNKSDLAGDPLGIERMVRAQQLNPLDPDRHSHLCFLARAYVNARRHDDAVTAARAALQRRPDYPHAHFILAIALAHLDRTEEARLALARCDELQPGFVAGRGDWRPYVDEAANRHLQDGLRKARTA